MDGRIGDIRAPGRLAAPEEAISQEEIGPAARNHGLLLEAMRHDNTPPKLRTALRPRGVRLAARRTHGRRTWPAGHRVPGVGRGTCLAGCRVLGVGRGTCPAGCRVPGVGRRTCPAAPEFRKPGVGRDSLPPQFPRPGGERASLTPKFRQSDAVLDDIDQAVLAELLDGARTPAAAVAARTGLPKSTVRRRIARLAAAGGLRTQVVLDPARVGVCIDVRECALWAGPGLPGYPGL